MKKINQNVIDLIGQNAKEKNERLSSLYNNPRKNDYKQVKMSSNQTQTLCEDPSMFYCKELDYIHQQSNEIVTKVSQFVDNWFHDRLKESFGFKGDYYNYEEVKNFLEDNNIQMHHKIDQFGGVERYEIISEKYYGLVTQTISLEQGTISIDTRWEEKK